jgi:hypothetical protein
MNEKNALIEFSSIEKNLENVNQVDLGIKSIPIDKIVGSLGRYQDFTEGFLPAKEKVSPKYESVKELLLAGKILPPIKVYQILDRYFVIDGHHRVTVAKKELNAKDIDAEVIKILFDLKLSSDKKYTYNTQRAKEFLIRLEENIFEKKTHLRNSIVRYPIKVTELTSFGKFFEEIINFKRKYNKGELAKKPIIYASYLWYEKRFLPSVKIISEEKILGHFQKRTYADLYLWIQLHKYYLSQKAGYDVGFDFTADDFLKKYRRSKFLDLFPDRVLDIVRGIKNEIIGK